MDDEIKVSVCCLAYNHEKYIRRALDGFVMQKTDFKYEVLIHDDASTDGTADIIREYERKYPDIIKPVYQKENQHSKGVKILWTYLYPNAKGKYIALCEGDDFWTDENKLQMQYDCLEKHTDCVFCTHTVKIFRETEPANGRPDKYPFLKEITQGVLLSERWLKLTIRTYQFQTSSYFFKSSIVKNHCNNLPDFIKISMAGDYVLMLLLSTYGNAYYINREMSCYRAFAEGSWSVHVKKDKSFRIKFGVNRVETFRLFDKYTGYKYTKFITEWCERGEFNFFSSTRKYEKMFEPKYKRYFDELPWNVRAYYTITAKCPWIDKICLKLRRK